MRNNKVILISVCGGTASGKTTVANLIAKSLPKKTKLCHLCLDSFYRADLTKAVKQNETHTNINFDHPNSFDWDLAFNVIKKLQHKQTVQIPIYDYTISKRSDQTFLQKPVDVIIFEGILTLYNEKINQLANIKIYVDSPDDERFIRRFLRDKKERGRTDENIIAQWRKVVRPMHHQFIEPQKANADIVIPWYNYNSIAVSVLNSAIRVLTKSNIRGTKK